MKSVDPAAPPQRRPGRSRRRRQDDARASSSSSQPARSRAWAASMTAPPTSTSSPRSRSASESLSLAVATFEHDGTRITLVDTPGYPDFVGRGRLRLRAPPTARSSSWTPRAASRPGSSRRSRSAGAPTGRVLLHQPLRQGERRPDRGARRAAGGRSATRSRRSTSRSARASRSAATSTSSIARPTSSRAARRSRSRSRRASPTRSRRRRDQLLEAAAEADDDVLTKYLEGEEISDAELDACLRKGVRDSILAPVLVGSATQGSG